MDLTNKMLVHQNDHYMVFKMPVEYDHNYHVCNTQFETVELCCYSLVEALVAAEEWSEALSSKSYLCAKEREKVGVSPPVEPRHLVQ